MTNNNLLETKYNNEELLRKLKETESKFNELNRNLEQKVIERTVEVNRLLLHKTKFIDHLSHDLGTPLTPLVTLLPIIKDSIDDAKLKEMIETCIRNVEYIKRVVQNTQKLAELGTTNLYLKKENLLEIIIDIQKKYDIVLKSCDIKLENNIDEDIYVMTEKSKIIELLDHIISNSVNSMIDGGKLSFYAKIIDKKTGKFIEISVQDTGVGLVDNQSNHLFDEFYKADESRHKLDSTGLGLTICKRIIEKHGGKIWAKSPGLNLGTTIYFTIPAA